MGEVYRADDLTLGQPVALKFLPAHLAADPDRLARFRKEVAAARKVIATPTSAGSTTSPSTTGSRS